MKIIVSVAVIGLALSSFCCEPEISCGWYIRKLKPYDPIKAGAEIITAINITNDIVFPIDNRGWWSVEDKSELIIAPYDLAEFNGDIYIHVEGTIYIFNKETLQIERKIVINFLEPEYVHSWARSICSRGFVVVNNRAFLYTAYRDLLTIDLSTGDVLFIDNLNNIKEKLDLTQNMGVAVIGYNITDDLFWFLIEIHEPYNDYGYFYQHDYFYFYQYEENINTFSHHSIRTAKYNSSVREWSAYINNNTVWQNGYSGPDPNERIWDIGMNRCSLDDPFTSLHFIDVEHLGTLSIPQSIIYDPPYIWIMVEREDQIQMLKLLPNG